MNTQHAELNKLGWSDWFEQRAECKPPDSIARVAAVDRGQLLLIDQAGQFRAKLSGSYLHSHPEPHERPCVGDWVCVEKKSGDSFAIIHSLLERRTSLRRKASGIDVEYQIIGANLDYALIVQSCHFDFNVKRLERYLVMVMEGGAEPHILLTKTDLVEPSTLAAQLAEIQAAGITAPILPLSNVTGDGLDDLKRLLLPGKTYGFVGSSGIGKTTLINQLIGHEYLQTGDISATGEGRHTTVRRELIRLDTGALVVDNPGMREFGIIDAEAGIEASYSDISELSSRCRFRDCKHTGESGCAVLAAVHSGAISQQHLENFLKLREESSFNNMSYTEKRRKDKNFGRYIKSAKKDLKGN